ncbi:gas vesicle protein [Lentzea alba]|uniref:gas vesicle protein GvpJ n=1 Tax=Lentzea alba TaxID=2714351 RepID=UPI0039BF46FB
MPEHRVVEHRAAEHSAASLVDLLDRVVHRGAVVRGDVVITLAGIELIRLDLRLLLIGVGGDR